MIKSMTGFATAEKTVAEITVSADIRAYNSKHLDVMLRVPSGYLHLEEKIKKRIAERIARGRLEVKIQIKDQSEGAIAFEVDHVRVRAIQSALTELKNEFGLHDNISLELLMSIGGIIKQTERVAEADIIWPVIERKTSSGSRCSMSIARKKCPTIKGRSEPSSVKPSRPFIKTPPDSAEESISTMTASPYPL